jgi:CRISPR-associated protein Cmr6
VVSKVTLPLYRTADAINSRSKDANAGLWYDKFCNLWDNREWELASGGKISWINTVTGLPLGSEKLLKDMIWRLGSLVLQRGGDILFFKTMGRFVTGLGRSHPVENGFMWHFTLGVPYLPGASVKGMARAWANTWCEEHVAVQRIFGPESKANSIKSTGTVIFHDAIPIKPVKLEADVMTPHYSEYYQGESPPGDWYSPIPIPFLTVAEGQTFLFALSPRRTRSESDLEDMKMAATWIKEALNNIGAGAKTASGYGRFAPDSEAQLKWHKLREHGRQEQEKKRQEQERLEKMAAMSPIRLEMERDGYIGKQGDFMTALTTKWLSRMEGAQHVQERLEIAELLAAWYQEKLPEMWKKPNKKNKDKIARILKVLGN